ncbi:hypothetical protein [Polynucleobacter necessarius]|uniref:hypothetical protein n=1 Tax=Polynucleobacter necessarius TaxID=576610 RepID=UPI000E0981D1|nr:hypothetical protein [Polynucleobacter necessarius]
MQILKKVILVEIEGANPFSGLRSTAFGVYLNLLEKFDSRQLFLFESLGPESIDTKVSLIGINPVFKIDVIDDIVRISGNQQLLEKLQLIFKGEFLLEPSAGVLSYRLTCRKAIWDFFKNT